MSSGAAQLPSHRGGRCRHRGADHGLPSAADAATRARLGPPSRRSPSSWPSRMSGRRPRRSSLGPRPLSTMRTDVRPTGRADVWCPGDRCPRDQVIRGVRTDTRPVSTAAAAALSEPSWIPESVGAAGPATLAHRVEPVAVVVRGLVIAARIGPGGKGWSNVGSAWLARGSTPDLDCHWVCVPATAPRSLLGDYGSWSSAGAGRLAGEQVLQVPP
jgi:hypothetical protein